MRTRVIISLYQTNLTRIYKMASAPNTPLTKGILELFKDRGWEVDASKFSVTYHDRAKDGKKLVVYKTCLTKISAKGKSNSIFMSQFTWAEFVIVNFRELSVTFPQKNVSLEAAVDKFLAEIINQFPSF